MIKDVKIPYRPGSGKGMNVSSANKGLQVKAFLLSGYEVGIDHVSWVAAEGGLLSFFLQGEDSAGNSKRLAYFNDSISDWWLRSPSGGYATCAWFITTLGDRFNKETDTVRGIRPAIILVPTVTVLDDGTIIPNSAPTTPGSITIPKSITGGTTITIQWGKSTDAEDNLEGYMVERSTNGGSSWSRIYQGPDLKTTNKVAYGTESVMYRVKAYDSEGLQSGYRTSSQVTVVNNTAPAAPGGINVPQAVTGGGKLTVTWSKSTDKEGNLSGYILERQVNGAGSWTQIYKGTALTYTDTITKGWTKVAYRVKAYDSYNAMSAYVTSPARTVDNNTAPTISCANSGDLGTKTAEFSISYSVNDAEKDKVTVQELMDGVEKRSFSAALGQSNRFDVTGTYFQQLLNGRHTMKMKARDAGGKSAEHTLTFTKSVTACSITMQEPMEADAQITIAALSVTGDIPADADYQVLVTNNAKDESPVWEDATEAVGKGANYLFTNKTAANGYAFNFKVTVRRGDSGTGGYISSIQGGFQ